jgi:hypothetical protein
MRIVEWTEGETAPRDFILKEDELPFDLTGFLVALALFDRTGAAVTTTGDITVASPQTGVDKGRVTYTPDSADLTKAKGDMHAKFKVTDPSGGEGYFPRGEPDIWRVYKP